MGLGPRRGQRVAKGPTGRDEADHVHECRHTYASFLMAAGYSLREIMDFMGHADLVTTDRYVKVLPQPAEADRSDRLNTYFGQVDQAT